MEMLVRPSLPTPLARSNTTPTDTDVVIPAASTNAEPPLQNTRQVMRRVVVVSRVIVVPLGASL
jgi:hypothetical protein